MIQTRKKKTKVKRGTSSKRNRTLERTCDQAIINTLKYRSIFRSCLSYHQLGTFLISEKVVDSQTFKRRTKNLIKGKKIKEKKGKYHLVKNKPFSWDARVKYADDHIGKVWFAFELLKMIKWVKLLAVSGSVAAYSSKKRDDIDIFIVTEKHRLWLTRFFVVILLKSVGKYRTDKDYNNKICPNILVDEETIVWPKAKRNVYTAHEILMMQPIISRDEMYFKFIKQNDWALDYFAGYNIHLPKKTRSKTKYESKLVDFFEFWAMMFQLWYMRKKKTTELTSRSFIHFNKYDHADKILGKYKKLTS